MLIRIKKVPPGEAPLWVRREWVGLELPLALNKDSPVPVRVHGVLSGPRNTFARLLALLMGRAARQRGFIVNASDAVDVLEGRSREAAEWWHQNASHMLQPGRYFVFEEGCAEVVGPDSR